MSKESIWAVVGGIVIGYIVWLVAISIGAALTTVSLWSLIVLALSALSGIWAVRRGRRLREQGNYPWAAFVYALPVPAVVLTLAVLSVTYL